MTTSEITLAVVLGLLANEMCNLSPWAARHLVRLAARLKYAAGQRRQVRTDELVALIEERPGRILKLITGLFFAIAAIPTWIWRIGAQGNERLAGWSRRYPVTQATTILSSAVVAVGLGVAINYLSLRLPHTTAIELWLGPAVAMFLTGALTVWLGSRADRWLRKQTKVSPEVSDSACILGVDQ